MSAFISTEFVRKNQPLSVDTTPYAATMPPAPYFLRPDSRSTAQKTRNRPSYLVAVKSKASNARSHYGRCLFTTAAMVQTKARLSIVCSTCS